MNTSQCQGPPNCGNISSISEISDASIKDSVPNRQKYSSTGFGGITEPAGFGLTYQGNVGDPYGSNIIRVSAENFSDYKYVAEFKTVGSTEWSVVIWNKIGPEGLLDGWYGHACESFTLNGGKTQYVAFDENSQGAWAAAPGYTIPTDDFRGYASTWGEFDFGSTINSGWSGFDVSAIAAQAADVQIQGMKICDTVTESCSSITSGGTKFNNAYAAKDANLGGIGGNLPAGPVRLSVVLGYEGDDTIK
ncbi:Allergen [Penicillium cosmopolitanum]|uniref:Allergen n=1 Tax=Penicillium cosmopolitanum TaxID=1131564 RepID=A0A9X0BFB4_9EURO|nr:Allergen [Penicillium cosmopolitanum]KAJ5415025.1 Allergen [Penicillium cosmopolitanum]